MRGQLSVVLSSQPKADIETPIKLLPRGHFIGLYRSRHLIFDCQVFPRVFPFFILYFIFHLPFNHLRVRSRLVLLLRPRTPHAHRFLPSTLGWLVRASSSYTTQRQVSPDIRCCQGQSGVRRKENPATRRTATTTTATAATTLPPTRHDDTQSTFAFGTSRIF